MIVKWVVFRGDTRRSVAGPFASRAKARAVVAQMDATWPGRAHGVCRVEYCRAGEPPVKVDPADIYETWLKAEPGRR